MNTGLNISLKSVAAPFYRINAGLFAFLIFIMGTVVGTANGVGLIEYHFSLIKGIMTSLPFLLFTFFFWFFYAAKTAQYVLNCFAQKEYGFFFLISLKKPITVFGMMCIVQTFLLFPVLSYGVLALVVGIVHHWWLHVVLVFIFFLMLIFTGAFYYYFTLFNPARRRFTFFSKIFTLPHFPVYWLYLLRYLWSSYKTVFLLIKLFSGVMLIGLLHGSFTDHSDLRMVVLFYSFGLLGHGVLVYQLREKEEQNLAFFRALPVSLLRRYLHYALYYFLLFIPELLIFARLSPVKLSYADAAALAFFGYTVLLFLNSISFIRFFDKMEYVKLVGFLYLLIFFAVLADLLPYFSVGLLGISFVNFFVNYYRFEK